MNEQNQIEIYQSDDGQIQLDVRIEEETVWLTLNQISYLFARDKSVISRHIRNVYKEKELIKDSTVAKYATVQTEGGRQIQREIEFYNLDVIISVGYRVKSKRGTQFRIWANRILKEFLQKGFALNEKILKLKDEKFRSLQDSIALIERLGKSEFLSEDETHSLLDVITKYVKALDLLDAYDHQYVSEVKSISEDKYQLNFDDAFQVVTQLKEKFASSALFGKEKDESFRSSIATIYQTFEGNELYPGAELKAANLLYFLVKNHSFVDGNKRIAAAVFLWFMFKNGLLIDGNGNKMIDDSALVGITLMIAESKPKEKDLIVNIILNLLNRN